VKDEGVIALLRAAQRIADGEALSAALLSEEGVPVSLRLVIAAVALVGADRPVNKKTITTIAPASRSATYRDHAELLDQVKTVLPALVQAQLSMTGSGRSATELARQLEEAHASIRRERGRRILAEREAQHAASYAAELHLRLEPEFDAIVREREAKVRLLRPVPTPNGPADG
jgi:hypothetical protein